MAEVQTCDCTTFSAKEKWRLEEGPIHMLTLEVHMQVAIPPRA